MAETARLAMAPTMIANTITLDSRARTMARKRCGTSSRVLSQCIRSEIKSGRRANA
jgi:hypothetical protein